MNQTTAKAWLGLIFIALLMSVILFSSAGTLYYWQAWVYLTIFLTASSFLTVYLIKTNPSLLKRRLHAGPTAEKEKSQKVIMSFISIEFIIFLLVPGLDFRFAWSTVPFYLIVSGNLLVIAGFYIIFLVYKANAYSSATIEVAKGQTVVSTGPYALVRHPMYTGVLVLLLGTPLALGSYWSLLVTVAMIPFLIWRLIDEEKFLAKHLRGYIDYQKKVIWRLIPGIY